MTISKNDFADEWSRDIFYWRERFNATRDFNHILEMHCAQYTRYANKVNAIYKNAVGKIRDAKERIVIYGAGVNAAKTKRFLEANGLLDRLACFCVSDAKNANVLGGGTEVRHIDSLLQQGDFLYLIPDGKYAGEQYRHLSQTLHYDENKIVMVPRSVLKDNKMIPRDDLRDIFFDPQNHFVIYGAEWTAFLIRHLLHYSNRDAGFVIAEQDRIADELGLLQSIDSCYFIVYEQSRRQKLLKHGIPDERIIHFVNTDELQYFDEEIVPRSLREKQGVFIDGGSADLYTSESFLQWCGGRCDKVLAFECDPRCVDVCKRKMEKNALLQSKVQLVEKGLWSRSTGLKFTIDPNFGSSSVYYPGGEGSAETHIPTATIDECAEGKNVSFIKLDIEGAELEALKGAQETIRKYRPTLAISIYHKPHDIVDLPEYIKSLVPEYKLYIRNYHFDLTEAVLYALYEDD